MNGDSIRFLISGIDPFTDLSPFTVSSQHSAEPESPERSLVLAPVQ